MNTATLQNPSKTQKAVSEVIEVGKKVAHRSTQRFPDAASFGDTIRQGDVYVTLLKNVPKGATLIKETPKQLAPGTTQGSRHTLDQIQGVQAFQIKDATEFDGPVIQLDCERILEHPEHGHWILPKGIFAISYQRTQDAVDAAARRVRD